MQKWMLAALMTLPTMAALATPNETDTGFSHDGRLDLGFVPSSVELIDSGKADDGRQKLLVAGKCEGASGVCVSRFLSHGENPADVNFDDKTANNIIDGDGHWREIIPNVVNADVVSAVGLSDGTTLLVLNSNSKVVLVKIKDDGSFDTNFDGDNDDDTDTAGDTNSTDGTGILENTDGNGIVKVDIGVPSPTVRKVRLLSNGSLLLGGDAVLNGFQTPFVARVNAIGQLDATFYGAGRRWFALQADSVLVNARLEDMQSDSNNRIIIAMRDASNHIVLNRISSTGATDAAFGTGIRLSFDEGLAQNASLAVDGSNEILLVSTLDDGAGTITTAMRKYKDASAADFGSGGKVVFTQAQLAIQNIALVSLPVVLPATNPTASPDPFYLGIGKSLDGSSKLFRLTIKGAIANTSGASDYWSLPELDAGAIMMANSGKWFAVDQSGVLLKLEGDDRSPDAISFARVDEVAIAGSVLATAQLVSGISHATTVTVSNGDVAVVTSTTTPTCTGTLTFTTATTVAADTSPTEHKYLCMRQTASTEPLTEKTTTITVGDRRATFTTKTKAASSGGGGGGGGALPLPLLLVLAGLFGLRRTKVQA